MSEQLTPWELFKKGEKGLTKIALPAKLAKLS